MFPLWTTFTQFQVSNVELCLHFKSCACIQNFHLLSDNNNAIKTLLNWASFLATSVATLSCQSQTSTQEKVPRKTHPDTSKPEQARYEHDTIPDTIRYEQARGLATTKLLQDKFISREDSQEKLPCVAGRPYLHEIKIFHVFYISWGYPS